MTTTDNRSRMAALLIGLLAAALASITLAAPAQAAAYRYWSYWQGDSGTWVAAQTGPGDYVLVDEDVQGWRFAITTDMPSAPPDNDPDFAALCPDLSAAGPVEGQVRAAVVIDAGFAADAPEGQTPPGDVVACVTVPEGSTGNQALAAAGTVTDQEGLICSINGYPADECGAEVSDADASVAAEAATSEQPNPAVVAASAQPTDTTTGSDTSGSSNVAGFVLGAAVLIGLIAAAFLIPRRRRAAAQDAA